MLPPHSECSSWLHTSDLSLAHRRAPGWSRRRIHSNVRGIELWNVFMSSPWFLPHFFIIPELFQFSWFHKPSPLSSPLYRPCAGLLHLRSPSKSPRKRCQDHTLSNFSPAYQRRSSGRRTWGRSSQQGCTPPKSPHDSRPRSQPTPVSVALWGQT